MSLTLARPDRPVLVGSFFMRLMWPRKPIFAQFNNAKQQNLAAILI
jgi:hypothetical protein